MIYSSDNGIGEETVSARVDMQIGLTVSPELREKAFLTQRTITRHGTLVGDRMSTDAPSKLCEVPRLLSGFRQ